LILPLADSKRAVKTADTKYDARNYEQLLDSIKNIEGTLTTAPQDGGGAKRFEDKTKDEINEDMARKRKQQFGKLVKFRYYQAGALMGSLFFYLFVYRRFLFPKPVLHSISYNQAVTFIKNNKMIKSKVGNRFQIMNCNGKMYPYKNDVKFDIVLFGTSNNAKVKVTSFYDRPTETWHLT